MFRRLDLEILPGELDEPFSSLDYLTRLRMRPCTLMLVTHDIEEAAQLADCIIEWTETHRLGAAKVAAPYFRQDERVVRYVLTQPPDRVSYRMLICSRFTIWL